MFGHVEPTLPPRVPRRTVAASRGVDCAAAIASAAHIATNAVGAATPKPVSRGVEAHAVDTGCSEVVVTLALVIVLRKVRTAVTLPGWGLTHDLTRLLSSDSPGQ